MAENVQVGILMGSASDLPAMTAAGDVLDELKIGYEIRIMSAHRTPAEADEFASTAAARGIKVLICGAGMAAHLAGAVAGRTPLPVIGVPLNSSLDGLDALLATVQMPPGVPVATVAIGKAGAKNAAWMAARIIGTGDAAVQQRVIDGFNAMADKVRAADAELQAKSRVNKPVQRRLQGKTGPRDIDAYPREQERLGRSLFSRVAAAVPRGRPAPVMFVLRRDTIDWFPLRELGGATAASRRRILAAMAGQDGVECVALAGAFRFQGSGPMNGQWVASVFIEWPDNRWWTAWQPIGGDRTLMGSEPQVRCAVDGSPRPRGVGGWFATSRRLGLKLRVQRNPPSVH